MNAFAASFSEPASVKPVITGLAESGSGILFRIFLQDDAIVFQGYASYLNPTQSGSMLPQSCEVKTRRVTLSNH